MDKNNIYIKECWINIMKEVYGMKPVFIREGENILPAFYKNSLYAGKRLSSLPFYNLSAPVIKSRKVFVKLIEKLIIKGKELNVDYIDIKFLEQVEELKSMGFEEHTDKYIIHRLSLTGGYEKVHSGYDRNLKSNLKWLYNKFSRNNGIIKHIESEEELRTFYRIYLNMNKRKFYTIPHPYKLFTGIYKNLVKNGNAEILIGKIGNRIIGGIVNIMTENTTIYKWSGIDQKFRSFSITSLLLDESIKRAIARGYEYYDFGFTLSSQKGLLEYKDHFGGIRQPVYLYTTGRYKDISPDTSYIGLRYILKFLPDLAVYFVSPVIWRFFL